MALVPRLVAVTPKLNIENKLEIEKRVLPTHYLLYIQTIINIITGIKTTAKANHIYLTSRL